VSIQNGIRELREERGWTQGQLATVVGVSRQSINNIERGRYVPSLELALKFARVFECPADEIFWISEGDL
jgi:putative transcriptional regulator